MRFSRNTCFSYWFSWNLFEHSWRNFYLRASRYTASSSPLTLEKRYIKFCSSNCSSVSGSVCVLVKLVLSKLSFGLWYTTFTLLCFSFFYFLIISSSFLCFSAFADLLRFFTNPNFTSKFLVSSASSTLTCSRLGSMLRLCLLYIVLWGTMASSDCLLLKVSCWKSLLVWPGSSTLYVFCPLREAYIPPTSSNGAAILGSSSAPAVSPRLLCAIDRYWNEVDGAFCLSVSAVPSFWIDYDICGGWLVMPSHYYDGRSWSGTSRFFFILSRRRLGWRIFNVRRLVCYAYFVAGKFLVEILRWSCSFLRAASVGSLSFNGERANWGVTGVYWGCPMRNSLLSRGGFCDSFVQMSLFFAGVIVLWLFSGERTPSICFLCCSASSTFKIKSLPTTCSAEHPLSEGVASLTAWFFYLQRMP